MPYPIRLALVLALTVACGKVEVNPDGAVDPDASDFTDGGSGADAAPEEDTTPPDTTIESAPVSPSGSATADFAFSASEAGCTFLCQLDGGTLSACPADHQVVVPGDGPHELEVRAVDPSGNQDPTPARHAWVVDTRAPVVTISTGPSNPTSESDAGFEFTADEEATFACRLDGGAFQACTSPADYAGLDEGGHVFEVRASDLAGNQGTDTWTWTMDAGAPSIEILTGPANPTSSTAAAFTFAAESGAAVSCRIDAGAFGPCASGTTMSYPSLAANTSHTFRVRATDAASNSAVAVYTWTIDTIAPTVQILNKPADPTNLTAAAFTFSVGEAATIECRLDGGAWGGCDSSTSMSYPSVPANASHTFRVRATDAALNTGTEQYTWYVDTAPPDVVFDAVPADPYPVDFADFAFHADDAVTYHCNLDGGGWQACSSPLALTKLGYAGHELQVRGIDALGNVETTPAVHVWKAERGLILRYPFDAHLKNASALGSRYDGDGGGFDFISGRVDQAIRFAQGEVKISDTRPLLTNDLDYTIAMWVTEAAAQTDNQIRYLFTNYANTQGQGGGLASFRYVSVDHELRSVFAGHTGATGQANTNLYATQTWHHVIFEQDATTGKGGDIRVYVDGNLATTIANPTSAVIFSAHQLEALLIGSNSRFVIDELRVYNRVYTLEEKCELIIGGQWVTPASSSAYCKM